MNHSSTIYEELKELNSSLGIEKANPYTVPDAYFENLPAAILAKVKLQQPAGNEELQTLSPLLASLSRKMPYSVPDNYFNETATIATSLIQEEVLPATMATLSRQAPYSVPDGYFENLPGQILAKVSKPQSKVISFDSRRWMRYASAAIITGAIALGSIFYFAGNSNNTSGIDPVKHPYQWVASKLKNVSNSDLEEFINTTDASAAHMQQTASNSNSGKEVRKMLTDVSTSELDNFLNDVPTDNDEATIN